jgi:hypothetical protein
VVRARCDLGVPVSLETRIKRHFVALPPLSCNLSHECLLVLEVVSVGLPGRQDPHQQAAGKVHARRVSNPQVKNDGFLRQEGLGVFRKRKLKTRVGRNPAPSRSRFRRVPV